MLFVLPLAKIIAIETQQTSDTNVAIRHQTSSKTGAGERSLRDNCVCVICRHCDRQQHGAWLACKLGAIVASLTRVSLRMLQAMNMIEHEEDIYARPARTWFQVRHRSPCLRPCLETLNCMTRCLG